MSVRKVWDAMLVQPKQRTRQHTRARGRSSGFGPCRRRPHTFLRKSSENSGLE